MEKFKSDALAKQNILEQLKEKTDQEKKKAQGEFENAMKARKSEIDKLEGKANQTDGEKQQLIDHKAKYEEVKVLLSEEKIEQTDASSDARTSQNTLKDSLSDFSIIKNAKDIGSWKELRQTKGYIRDIQLLILKVGASKILADDPKKRLSDEYMGPTTKAGVQTIQRYLMDSYAMTPEDVGCTSKENPDGIPGPKTLAALLTPVSTTDPTTRLQEMIKNKPTFSMIYSTDSGGKKETTKTNNNNTTSLGEREKTTKGIESPSIGQKKEDKVDGQINKVSENTDQFGLTIKNISSISDMPKGYVWPKTKKEVYVLQIDGTEYNFYGNGRVAIYKGIKEKGVMKNTQDVIDGFAIENRKNTVLNENMKTAINEDINKSLTEKIKNEPIDFTKDDKKYQDYYTKNITSTFSTTQSGEDDIRIKNGIYSITLPISRLYNPGTKNVDYDIIRKEIKKDIISKVDNQEKIIAENKGKEVEIEKNKVLKKKYDALRDYLVGKSGTWTWSNFPIEYFYPKKEDQTILVKAFFKDFQGYLGGKGVTFRADKKATQDKKIELTIDNDGTTDKYGKITLDIDKMIKDDGTINKEAIEKELRASINKIINPIQK